MQSIVLTVKTSTVRSFYRYLSSICVKRLDNNSKLHSINKRLIHFSIINPKNQNKSSNLSAVLHAIDDLRLEEYPMPSDPGPNDLLLKTLCVGICGSDVHYWKHGFIGDFVLKEPIIMGHETSAQVIGVGSQVDDFQVGDRVCCEPAVPCRMCSTCKEGQYNLCGEMLCHATPPHNGTLTQYFKHPADYAFKLPDDMSAEEGAMIEPLSVAVYACRRAGVTAGSAVLVTGAGPIGMFVSMTAKAFGAHKVVIMDLNEKRLKLAKSIGVDVTIAVNKDDDDNTLLQKVKDAFGRPIDITVECCGAPSLVRLAMLATKDGGTVLLTGHGPRDMSLPMATAAIREVTIMGSFRYRNAFPLAIALVSTGRIQLQPLISHRFPFEKTLDAFNTAFKGEGVKVIIKVND